MAGIALDADGKATMPTLDDEMIAATKKNRANQSKKPNAVDPNASTMTGPNSILAPLPTQVVAATPPSAPTAPLNARDTLNAAAADRERVLSDIWRARYGSPENRNPAAVPGLIAQRKFLERGISEGRAAVEPTPVMPFADAQRSRNSIIDLYEQENMRRAAAANAPAVAQPTFVPRSTADYARLGDMQRMGVNDIDMRELERLSGRPSPPVAYTPMTEPQITPPPRLTRDAYDLEAGNEQAKREAAYAAANREGSVPQLALGRLAQASTAEREMVALQREIAANELKARAIQSDPNLIGQRMEAENEQLRTQTSINRIQNQNALTQAERAAAAESVSPEVTSALNGLIARAGSVGGGGIGMFTGPQESEQIAADTERQVNTILSAIQTASPAQKAQLISAVDTALANLRTTPGPVTGLIGAGTTDRYYQALQRLRAALGR